jgi:hypothetical protein
MNIFFNKEGIPFIVNDDNTIVDFSPDNFNYIIGELSTDKQSLDKIFAHLKKSIDNKIKEYQDLKKSNFLEFKDAAQILFKIGYLANIVEICERAEDYYYRLSTPQPYDVWFWDSLLREWRSPYEIPYGKEGEYYSWDSNVNDWVPSTPAPGEGYNWSRITHEWEPIVKYPIDAAPGEFVWDTEKSSWVLNS